MTTLSTVKKWFAPQMKRRNRTARPVAAERCEDRRVPTTITGAQIAAFIADPDDQMFEAYDMGAISGTHTDRTHMIASATDVDMFKFTVSAGQTVAFDIDRPSGNHDSFIRLFDASGYELARNDDAAAPGESSGRESYLEHTFLSSGTFYLGVSGYGNSSYSADSGSGDTNGSTGIFDLTISNKSSSETTTRFDTESNNSKRQANFIHQFDRGYHSKTFYGSTGSGSDTQDWFKIRVTGRTTGSIILTGMYQDLDLELYNSTSSFPIARSINAGTRNDTINLNGLAAGDYYIRVMPGVSGARSAYALRFGVNVS